MDQNDLTRIMGQYSTYLQIEKGVQPGTHTVYVHSVSYFISFCSEYHEKLYLPENWGLEDLGVRELEFFLRDHLKERGWKVNTVISYLNSIRSFFRFLFESGYLEKNPIRHYTMKQQMKELVFAQISEEDLKKLFDNPPEQSFEGFRNRLILELFYGLGITPTKLTYIDKVQLDDNEKKIYFTSGKQTRILPISQSAIDVFHAYMEAREMVLDHTQTGVTSFLINHLGRKLTRSKIVDALKKELEKIGVIGERVHVLRNLSTKHFADHGADVRSLQTHRDMKTLLNLDQFKNESFNQVFEQFKQMHIRDSSNRGKV